MKSNEIETRLNILRSEIIACARYIKTWEAIALAKNKFKDLDYDDFFGYIQLDFMHRLIALSVIKISDSTKKYLLELLGNVFSKQQTIDLLKRSHIDNALKKLKKEYDKTLMKEFRNKRIAHIEYAKTPFGTSGESGVNLLEIYNSIAEIEDSVNYISFCVLNPSHENPKLKMETSKNLDNYFKNSDFFMLDLNRLLNFLNSDKK